MNNARLSAPWYIYYNKIVELFKYDPEISIDYKDDDNTIILIVNSSEKAHALKELLPPEKYFGNVTVHINIIPVNSDSKSDISLFEKAFKGNPIVVGTVETKTPFDDTLNAIIFKDEVVHYYSDDMFSNKGYTSTLYESIAEDIFPGTDVYFWTNIKG